MSPTLTRLLTCLYPRYWRERYGDEFEALLQTSAGDLRTSANVVWSALCERVSPIPGLKIKQNTRSFRCELWSGGAPWAVFSLSPLILLTGAYLVSCLILWSGWRVFLPGASTPFVPVEGLAKFYFGAGRLLYYGAPILIGWGLVFIAARQKIKLLWPIIGLSLVALLGGTARVHASRPFGARVGRISMDFAIGPFAKGIPTSLCHALIILSLTLLPSLLLRLQKARSLSA